MYKLDELFESTLENVLADEHPDLDAGQVKAMLPDIALAATDKIADQLLDQIRWTALTGGLQDHRADRLGFELRLETTWRRPLDLLDLFVHLATEAGTDFNSKFQEDGAKEKDAVFEALRWLHGRSCQVAKEVLVLLRSGYADGAHARWRTLHEIAVVACLIGEYGQPLAEKYLLHEIIQQYKMAEQFQKHCHSLNQEPMPPEEFAGLKEERDRLVTEFGKAFKEDYGWAAAVTEPRHPTFANLEEKADLGHWCPYYKMASGNVHPNSHGSYHRLGLASHQERVILAGPSNQGLADPGHSTAISLLQVTLALLGTEPILDCMIVSRLLESLANEVGEAFLEAHLIVERVSQENLKSRDGINTLGGRTASENTTS